MNDRTAQSHEPDPRHEALRQELLSDKPEGREPAPRTLHISWILFHTVLTLAVAALLVFLWALGGWQLVLPGIFLTLCVYFIAYWAIYAALALRMRDKLSAERKAERIERIIESHR